MAVGVASQDDQPEISLPAIDVYGLAGDETAVVGAEESHRRCYLLGFALSLQGNSRGVGDPAGVPFRVGTAGVYASRRYDVTRMLFPANSEARLRAIPTIPILAAET